MAQVAKTRNFIDAIEVHKALLSSYRNDFAKHAPKNDLPSIGMFKVVDQHSSLWHKINALTAKVKHAVIAFLHGECPQKLLGHWFG